MKKYFSILFVIALFVCTFISGVQLIQPNSANAATTGDCGAFGTSFTSADAKVITWAGKKWDVIGINGGGRTAGVAGPQNTVTILLDQGSTLTDSVAFGTTANGNDEVEYSKSAIKTRMETLYSNLSSAEQGQLISRTIKGGGADYASPKGANWDNVAGTDVADQYFWSLSSAEATNLKASVRQYKKTSGTQYWLRNASNIPDDTAGSWKTIYTVQDGPAAQNSTGGIISAPGDSNTRASGSIQTYDRPAAYLSYSEYQSLGGTTTDTLGTCAITPTINLVGYTFDIVGINNSGTTSGQTFSAPSNTATLVLSKTSNKKVGFGTSLKGKYASMTDPDYSSSNLKTAIEQMASELSGYNSQISARNLTDVQGSSVSGAKLWPMSKTEMESLDYPQRIYNYRYWLRTGTSSRVDFGTENGSVGSDKNASPSGEEDMIRPALYLTLDSDLINRWNNREAAWGGSVSNKLPVTASCFNYTAPSSLEYNKSTHPATVTNNNSCSTGSGIGTLAIYYEGANGTNYTKSATAPTNAGTYNVIVQGIATANYDDYADLVVGTFTIGKRILTPKIEWNSGSGNFDASLCGSSNATPGNCGSWSLTRPYTGTSQASDATAQGGNNMYGNIASNEVNVTIGTAEGLMAGDTLTSAGKNTSSAAIWNSPTYASQGKCYNWVVPRSSSPVYDFTTPDAGSKSLSVTFQPNVACSFWDNYKFSVNEVNKVVGSTAINVFEYALSGAGTITQSTNTLQVTANDVTVNVGDSVDTSKLTARVTGGAVTNDPYGTNPYTGFTGSLSIKSGCVTTAEGQFANCIEQGSLTSPNYSSISFTPGKLIVQDIPKIQASIPAGKVTVSNKTYDGSTSATISTGTIAASDITGRVGTDDITATCSTATFANSDAGNNKTVNISGCTLSGQDANKYSLSSSTTTTATINKANQTISFANTTPTDTYTGSGYQYSQGVTGGSGTGTVLYQKTGGTGEASVSATGTPGGIVNNVTKAGTIIVSATKQADTNYNAATASYTLTINKANQTAPTVNDIAYSNIVNYGDGPFQLAVTGGSQIGTLSFALSSGTAATVSTSGVLTITGTGNIGYTATYSGNDLYNSVTSVVKNAGIEKKALTVTADNVTVQQNASRPDVSTLTYQVSGLVGSDTASSVLEGSLAWAGSGCETSQTPNTYAGCIEQGTLAVKTGNNNYTLTSGNFTKGSLFITDLTPQPSSFVMDTITNKTYGDADFAVSATGYLGGGAVSYEITAGGTYASISGASVSILGATGSNSVQVRACIAENGTYAAGCTQPVSFAIAKYTTNVTGLAATNRDFSTGNTSVTVDTSSASFSKPTGKSSDNLTLSGCTGTVSDANAGTNNQVTIPASSCSLGGTSVANYQLGTVNQPTVTIFKINQAALTVDTVGTLTYGDSAYSLSATGGSTSGALTWECVSGCATSGTGETVTLNASTGSITINKAGNFKVKATRAGDTNYNAVTSADSAEFTVQKYATNVTGLTATNRTYNTTTAVDIVTTSASFTKPTGKTADNLTVSSCVGTMQDANAGTGKSVTISGCVLGGTAVNNYVLNSYNTSTSVNITGDTRTLTATASSNSFVWNQTAPTLSATQSAGIGTISWTCTQGCPAVAQVSENGTISNVTGVGTFKVQAHISVGTNYNAADSNELTLTTTKANQSALTVSDPASLTYGDSDVELSTTGGSGTGAVTYAVVSGPGTIVNGKLHITGAGNIVANATKVADANYNAVTSTNKTIAISPKSLTVTIKDKQVKVGTDLSSLTFSNSDYEVTGLVGTDTLTAGSVKIDNGNASCVSTSVSAGIASCIIVDTAFSAGANYTITTPSPAKLIVLDKEPQPSSFVMNTITNKTYGDADFGVSATGGAGTGGLTYEITAGGTFASISGNTITINAVSDTNNVSVRACKATDNDYAAGCTNSVSFQIAKFVTDVAGIQATNREYDGSTEVQIVTSAATFSRPAGKTAITDPLTITCRSTGEVTTADIGTNKEVTLSNCQLGGTAAANYALGTIAPVTVNITKTNQSTLTVDAVGDKTYGDADVELSTTGGSGTGAVTYTVVSGPGSIVNGKLHISGAGTISLKATKAGDSTYEPAESSPISVTVNAKTANVVAKEKTVVIGTDLATLAFTSNDWDVTGLVNNDPILQGSLKIDTANNACVSNAVSAGISNCIIENVSFSAGTNYAINFTPGTLKVTAAPLIDQSDPIAVASPGGKFYGDADFNLSLEIAKQGSGSGAVSYSCVQGCPAVAEVESSGLVTIKGAGTFKVIATKAADLVYNAKTSPELTISISKADLTITADDLTVVEDSTLSTFSYSVLGLKYSDTDSIITAGSFKLKNGCSTLIAGTFTGCIVEDTKFAINSNNYNLIVNPGNLTVTPATDELVDDLANGGSETGIRVRGIDGYSIDSSYKLNVDIKNNTDTFFNKFQNKINGNDVLDKLFDIYFTSSDQHVNFENIGKIRIIIPDAVVGQNYKLWHLHYNEQVSESDVPVQISSAKIGDTNAIVFDVDKLSYFGISHSNNENNSGSNSELDQNGTCSNPGFLDKVTCEQIGGVWYSEFSDQITKSDNSKLAKTGLDYLWLMGFLVLLLVSFGNRIKCE